MKKERSFSRRDLVKALALGGASSTVLYGRLSLSAEPLPKLDVNDPAAVAVGYVENAARVDTKKFPGYVQGSTCDNCLLLQGKPGNSFRPCSLFQGKLVSVGGWCSGWTAEM
jgi:High potential iron-sulfur protein